MPNIPRKFRTYGFSEDADIRAFNIQKNGLTTCFEVNDGEKIFPVKLNMAGKHNVLNALAAITVARELDISRDVIIDSLAKFGGVGRRFTYHGKINHAWGTADIFEDYGHHPSEIKAVLDSAKESFPNRRILPVFQPHRYTRTRDLLDDFAAVLSDSEALVLTEVYSAGEQPIAGADSKALSRAIRAFGQVEPVLISDKKEIIENLKSHILKDNDVVIFLGAGDIGRLAKEIVAENK